MSLSKVTTCLWFTAPQALHAAQFYIDLFNNSPSTTSRQPSHITSKSAYPKTQTPDVDETCKPDSPGSLLTVSFTLAGAQFVALNGNKPGSEMPWKFNEAVSFQIACASQEEIDWFWDGLVRGGGQESFCGWCKDRWGVSWQVVPEEMQGWMSDEQAERKERVVQKMYTMRKMDLEELRKAARGK